jgi:hypothetical protein
MSAETKSSEERLRERFNFTKPERGRFVQRYKEGTSVTVLTGAPDADDPLSADPDDSQLVEIAGKHLLISRLIAAGYEVAEPIRDKGIDLIVYRDSRNFEAFPIQMKAFTRESFSLDQKYEGIPNLHIAYVWNVNASIASEVYLLTYSQALGVLTKKGYAKSRSWRDGRYYYVRDAGSELKKLLGPFHLSPARRQFKARAAG